MDELALRRGLCKIHQQRLSLWLRPADDCTSVRGKIDRFATGARVYAHEPLTHRFEALALLIGKVSEAELGTREHLRVLTHKRLDEVLGFLVKGIIGRPHVGKFGISSL